MRSDKLLAMATLVVGAFAFAVVLAYHRIVDGDLWARLAVGAPRSRRRKRWPACVPGGILSFTGPSSDGTSTRAPRTASCTPMSA